MAVERISELRDTNEIKLWKISEGMVRTIQIYTFFVPGLITSFQCLHNLFNVQLFEFVKWAGFKNTFVMKVSLNAHVSNLSSFPRFD